METEKTTISEDLVILDGKLFKDINFERCILVYKGGTRPVLRSCFFDNCTWQLEGKANNTLYFIRDLIQTGEDSMKHWVLTAMLGLDLPAPEAEQGEGEDDARE